MWWMLLVFACARGPVVHDVGPAEVAGGDVLVVEGERLREGLGAHLEIDGADRVPLAVSVLSRERLEAKLPARVRPGDWQLVVSGPTETLATLPVRVVTPREEPACIDEYTANTEVSLRRAEVVIDRYYRAGDKEKLRFALGDIARIEYERVELADGPCSAVYLRTDDGRRVVFSDDRAVDLYERAHRVAQAMGKELVVIRPPDGAAMTDDAP